MLDGRPIVHRSECPLKNFGMLTNMDCSENLLNKQEQVHAHRTAGRRRENRKSCKTNNRDAYNRTSVKKNSDPANLKCAESERPLFLHKRFLVAA